MNKTQQRIIEEKFKKAGIGHFIDIYIKLFDPFVSSYSAASSGKIEPKQILGCFLALMYKAVPYIDDKTKLREYMNSAAPLISNFIGDEFALVQCDKELSEYDKAFLEKVEKKSRDLFNEKEYIQSMERVLAAVDDERGMKDKQNIAISAHCERVAGYTKILCRNIGLSKEETEKAEESAKLHDIGKICMPKEFYEARKLNRREFAIVKRHPLIGHWIFRGVGHEYFADGAGFHHERWDGSGYPYGKKDEEIPFIATVISVADAYDAMRTRPWSSIKTHNMALDEIIQNAGTQFNPDVAKKETVENLGY